MKSLLTIAMLYCLSTSTWATEAKLEKVQLATDIPSLERGVDTLMNACHSCHSMKYLRYRDLLNLGLDKAKVDGWRGEQSPDTAMLAQMPDSDAMQAFGKAPPDLSLMAKARDGGADYVYSYLVGYYVTATGMPGNHVYPETKMPDPLGITGVTDAVLRAEIQGKARDVVSFLAWAADPHQQERHRLGYYVLAYLVVLTGLLYLVKNQVWAKLK